MPNVPVKFRKSGEQSVASFSFQEFTEGNGTIIYNGITHDEEGTQTYSLLTPVTPSFSLATSAAASGGSATKVVDVDFDITFNQPAILIGTARAIFTFFLSTSTGTGGNPTFFIVKLRKDSGGESEIISAQTNTVNHANSTNKGYQQIMEMTVPRTHFKKGDILRVTVEGWSEKNGTRTATIGFAHDPLDADSGSIPDNSKTKQFKIYIPFDIDL